MSFDASVSCGRCEKKLLLSKAEPCAHCEGPLCEACWESESYCEKPECQQKLRDLLERAGKRAH